MIADKNGKKTTWMHVNSKMDMQQFSQVRTMKFRRIAQHAHTVAYQTMVPETEETAYFLWAYPEIQ